MGKNGMRWGWLINRKTRQVTNKFETSTMIASESGIRREELENAYFPLRKLI
ncbi:MAG: hypothetical protein F6K17_18895 [Okeania sp. SIO3C4]|nr:hypothetical protein [Okeania sp. SIO3C4]